MTQRSTYMDENPFREEQGTITRQEQDIAIAPWYPDEELGHYD